MEGASTDRRDRLAAGETMMAMHRELAVGRWFDLPLVEQLAHVGSEVERTMRWRAKGSAEHARQAFERALELLEVMR